MRSSDLGVVTSTSAENDETVFQAAALARSLRLHNPGIPVMIGTYGGQGRRVMDLVADDAGISVYPLDGHVRRLADRGYDLSEARFFFLRKLLLLAFSPFERTLWLDNDMLVFGALDDVMETFSDRHLAMVVHQGPSTHKEVNVSSTNELDPSRSCEILGLDRIFHPFGGGHYYLRRTPMMRRILAYCWRLLSGRIQDGHGRDLFRWVLNNQIEYNPDEPAMIFSLCQHKQEMMLAGEIVARHGVNFVGFMPLEEWHELEFLEMDVPRGECVWKKQRERRPRRNKIFHFFGEAKIWHNTALGRIYRREVEKILARGAMIHEV